MRYVLIPLIALGGAVGQPVLFEDHFDDPSLGAHWSHTTGPMPAVVNGALQLDGGARVFTGESTWADTSLTIRWRGLTGSWVVEMFFRRNAVTNAAWSLLVNSGGTVQLRTQSGSVVAQSTASVSSSGWNTAHIRALGDTITAVVEAQLVFDHVLPSSTLAQARTAGEIGLGASNLCAFDDIVVDRACDGVGVTLTVDPVYGFTTDVCSGFPGRFLVVIMNSLASAVPLGPYGATQVGLGGNMIPLAAPFFDLGPPVDYMATTDSSGGWSISFPSPLLFWIYGPGTLHVEAFIIDFTAPNGLFHQSNMASMPIL